nr:hypothetical protein Itr_chr06CG02770 [Ipomoea trifida]
MVKINTNTTKTRRTLETKCIIIAITRFLAKSMASWRSAIFSKINNNGNIDGVNGLLAGNFETGQHQ